VQGVALVRLLVVWCLLAVSAPSRPACAQFTDPRNYENSPVGVNQLELAYAYARSDSSIDSAIIITNAKLNLNQGSIGYTRYFGFFRRMAWIESSIPIAGLSGSISGTQVSGSTAGAGDSSYGVAMLLKGGPALSIADFANYNPMTTVGVSLSVTAPTGLYRHDQILNLGSNRWSFSPEIAVSCPFGPQQKWALDAYANSGFYTDNTSYRGKEVLRQQAIPGFETHISYLFAESLVGSLDARYSFRGETFVNGVNQNNSQRNFILGSEVIVSLNARHSLAFTVAKAIVHENGSSVASFSVKYHYLWGTGYR
jgi:hypothetical protein